MEEKNQIRASLVSRLPKYGTKAVGNILQRAANGTAVNLSGSTQSFDKTCSKHNGTLHTSSFAFHWRKSNRYQLDDRISRESDSNQNPNKRLTDSEQCHQPQGAADNREVLSGGSNSTSSKIAKQTNMFVSPTEAVNQKSLPSLSGSTKLTKSTLLGRASSSGLSASKSHLNGVCGSRPAMGFQRTRGNSTATGNNSRENLPKATINVKSSCEKMVRSQSFSYSIQNSLLPSASLTRSHSFNRAVDLIRPYQNQPFAIRASQRPNLLSRNSRHLDMPNSNDPLRYGFSRSFALASSALKKQPLSNGSGDAPSLRFRTGRPSLLKPSNQHLGRKIPVDGNASKENENCIMEEASVPTHISVTVGVKSVHKADDDERAAVGDIVPDSLVESGCKGVCLGGEMDEISISSLSSSEKNDLSEDFSDDFIDLEDPNGTIRIQEEDIFVQELEHGNGMSLGQFWSLKENERSNCNSDEWLDIHESAKDDPSESAPHLAESHGMSSDVDYRASSSLELSPSDSSDGTYMWDEEGLEPMGNLQPCGSYDTSEMNSIDILNNLDSCDLEDDDLMLDVDLPEDAPYENVDCENMNHHNRADRNCRHPKEGRWPRAPQRWTPQDHYHLGHPIDHGDHRNSPFDALPMNPIDGSGASSSLYPPLFVSLPANTVMLDEMTLRHMVQDCTAVKTQLLKMKRILHQNDENASLHNIALSLPPSPELPEPVPVYKTDDLLSEITQLKEDLKTKDEAIHRLEQQLSVRCKCNSDSQKSAIAVCTYADKFTQTNWRRNAPQVLQSPSHLPNFTDLAPAGTLTKTSHIAAHSEQDQQDAANGSFTSSINELSTLPKQKSEENAHSIKTFKGREKTKEPKEMTGRKAELLQSHSFPFQSSNPVCRQEKQTKLAWKTHGSQAPQASSSKTSRAPKPPGQNAFVPPPVAAAASLPTGGSASKEPGLPPAGSLTTQLRLEASPSSLTSKRQTTSKLRPPAISFRAKQVTNPKLRMPPEPQHTLSKTNCTRPLMQAKENMKAPGSSLSSGHTLSLPRHSRLPKPKTY